MTAAKSSGEEFPVDPTVVVREETLRSDRDELHGYCVVPRQIPWASVIVVHGYGEHGGRYAGMMRWMAERGVATFTWDQRGHGKSPGRRGFVWRWEEYLDDLQSVLRDWSRQVDRRVPLFVLGHSHGALIVAAAAVRGEIDVSGIILVSPFLKSGVAVSARRLAIARAVGLVMPWAQFASRLDRASATSDPVMLEEARNDPLLLRIATPRWYVRMLAAQSHTLASAPNCTLPMLCLIGDADRVALPAGGEQFFNAAGSSQKQLIHYPGMLHELLRESDRVRVFEDILGWLRCIVSETK